MRKFFHFIIFWLSLLGSLQIQATDSQEVSIVASSFLVDPTGQSTINDMVLSNQRGEFQSANKKPINFSINDSVVWFTCKVNTTTEPLYISPGNESTVWEVALYFKNPEGKFEESLTYDHLNRDFQKGVLPFRTVALELPDNYDGSVYLRLASQRHKNFSLKVGNLTSMTSYLIQKEMIPIGFIAIMLSIFIYNVFLLVSTKDLIYIPYLLYVLFISYAIPFHGGYVLFSAKWMWQSMPLYTTWTSLGYLIASVFAILYLDLKNIAPRFNNWIIFLSAILIVFIPIIDITGMFDFSFVSKILSLTSFIFYLSLWSAGVYAWVKGRQNAKFYVVGWLFALSSMILFILSVNGIIEYTNFVEQSFFYGFAIEAVLFAFAIGGRMNMLRLEKRALEAEHINYITEQNRLLAKQSFMNSHLLRTPLSRVLGLVNLLKSTISKEENDEYVSLVEESTAEMDEITKKMSVMLEREGYLDEYQEDFEEVKQSIYNDLNKKSH